MLFALARTELTTALARLFTGLFVSSFCISAVLYVSDLGGDEKRGKYVAYLAAVQTACGAAGYFAGGLLGTVSIFAAFIGQAAVCLGAALLTVLLVRSEPKKEPMKKHIGFPNPFKSFIIYFFKNTFIFIRLVFL